MKLKGKHVIDVSTHLAYKVEQQNYSEKARCMVYVMTRDNFIREVACELVHRFIRGGQIQVQP